MSTRIAAAAAALSFVLGAVAQLWSPRLGLTLMLLGVLCAIASTLLLQRTIQRRLMKHERYLLALQQSVTTGTRKLERSLTAGAATSARNDATLLREVTSLATSRTTAPAGAGSVPADAPAAPAASATPAAPAAAAPGTGQPEVGRAATPEVTNPFTDETLHSMLAPGRVLTVAGLLPAGDLPEHRALPWIPGEVMSLLERERPDLVVVDEAALGASPVWSSATTAVGTALMRELLAGISWAQDHRIPVYLLTADRAPDVHSAALRGSGAARLPLGPDALDAAAGAPQTPLLHRLQELAAARTEGAA